MTETHKQTDQLLLECCGAGSSFAGRLLDRTVQTDLCLVLSKPGVYSSKLQKNKKERGSELNCLCTVTCIQHIVSDLRAL